jgi:hypothetical protein
VVSLIGDIAMADGNEPKLHAHVVLGCRDGSARAGHLMAREVRPTLEVIVNQAAPQPVPIIPIWERTRVGSGRGPREAIEMGDASVGRAEPFEEPVEQVVLAADARTRS